MILLYIPGVILAVLLMAQIHSKIFGYVCKECHEKFEISAVTNVRSPHLFKVTYLKCPHCHKVSWCRDISKNSKEWLMN